MNVETQDGEVLELDLAEFEADLAADRARAICQRKRALWQGRLWRMTPHYWWLRLLMKVDVWVFDYAVRRHLVLPRKKVGS